MANRFRLVQPLLLASLAAATSLVQAQTEVYKSRDAQGNVIFSDKSSASGEAVKLPPTNTLPEVAAPTRPPTTPATTGAAAVGYTLAIVTPVADQTVFSATGSLEVSVSVAPALQPGHSLRLLLDGTPAGIPQQGAITLEGVGQGTHTLEVQVLDASGELVQSSGTISVHLQRPGRPRRPG